MVCSPAAIHSLIRQNAQGVCPRCGSDRVHRNGSFLWKDGTRRRRYLCCDCGRTFNPHTGTPLHYLKKRSEWARQASGLAQSSPLRRIAADVEVCLATAFDWRQRLLGALSRQPQASVRGSATLSEAYVPYSEKGSRTTHGPGAYRKSGVSASTRRFRRFIDGKPTCVLLARAGLRLATGIASQGRPDAAQLRTCLSTLLEPGAEVWTLEPGKYATACQADIGSRADGPPQGALTWQLRTKPGLLPESLHAWLWPFRGVATRYLPNYLVWYRSVRANPRRPAEQVGWEMLSRAMIVCPERPAS